MQWIGLVSLKFVDRLIIFTLTEVTYMHVLKILPWENNDLSLVYILFSTHFDYTIIVCVKLLFSLIQRNKHKIGEDIFCRQL